MLSTMDQQESCATAPPKLLRSDTSPHAALVEVRTEQIPQKHMLAHVMQKFVQEYQRLDPLFRAVFGVEMNGFVCLERCMYT